VAVEVSGIRSVSSPSKKHVCTTCSWKSLQSLQLASTSGIKRTCCLWHQVQVFQKLQTVLSCWRPGDDVGAFGSDSLLPTWSRLWMQAANAGSWVCGLCTSSAVQIRNSGYILWATGTYWCCALRTALIDVVPQEPHLLSWCCAPRTALIDEPHLLMLCPRTCPANSITWTWSVHPMCLAQKCCISF